MAMSPEESRTIWSAWTLFILFYGGGSAGVPFLIWAFRDLELDPRWRVNFVVPVLFTALIGGVWIFCLVNFLKTLVPRTVAGVLKDVRINVSTSLSEESGWTTDRVLELDLNGGTFICTVTGLDRMLEPGTQVRLQVGPHNSVLKIAWSYRTGRTEGGNAMG